MLERLPLWLLTIVMPIAIWVLKGSKPSVKKEAIDALKVPLDMGLQGRRRELLEGWVKQLEG